MRHAYLFHSRQPIHRTHGVVVHFEFGFGLGKIDRLVKYEVVTLYKLRESLPFLDEATKSNLLGGEDSPALRESRKLHPNNVLLPVVLLNMKVGEVFGGPIFLERNPGDIYDEPVKRSEKKTAKQFRALQQFKFPDVVSPEFV